MPAERSYRIELFEWGWRIRQKKKNTKINQETEMEPGDVSRNLEMRNHLLNPYEVRVYRVHPIEKTLQSR